MKRLPSYALILQVAILLLAVIFLALDFKTAFSFTTDDTQVTTISSGEGYAEDLSLVIFVQAPNSLAEPLRRALFNQVGTIAPFSTMELIETPASDPDSASLVVVVDRRTYIWTPVYSTANLSVRVAFASDGRVNWDQLGEINTVLQASEEVRMSGDMEIRDRSLGLISYPGYRSHLAEQISDKVVESIKTAFTTSTHRASLKSELRTMDFFYTSSASPLWLPLALGIVINPDLVVQSGVTVQMNVINEDDIPHDLSFQDFSAKSALVFKNGKTTIASFDVKADQIGTYTYFCTQPGHRRAGQEGQLIVIVP